MASTSPSEKSNLDALVQRLTFFPQREYQRRSYVFYPRNIHERSELKTKVGRRRLRPLDQSRRTDRARIHQLLRIFRRTTLHPDEPQMNISFCLSRFQT